MRRAPVAERDPARRVMKNLDETNATDGTSGTTGMSDYRNEAIRRGNEAVGFENEAVHFRNEAVRFSHFNGFNCALHGV